MTGFLLDLASPEGGTPDRAQSDTHSGRLALSEAQLLVLLRRAHKGERPAHIVLELYANTKELEQG